MRAPDIELRKISGILNIIAREYGRIDHDMLWSALADRMPEVATFVNDVLER